MFKVLPCTGILDIYRLPIRPALLLSIRHIFTIMAPVGRAQLGLAILGQGIWVHEKLSSFQRVGIIDSIRVLLFDPIPLCLRHQSAIIAEIVMVTVLSRNAHLGVIPIIGDRLFELISIFALIQELVGKFVL